MLDWKPRGPVPGVLHCAKSAETGVSYSVFVDIDGSIHLSMLLDDDEDHVVTCSTVEWAKRLASIFDAGLALVLAGP